MWAFLSRNRDAGLLMLRLTLGAFFLWAHGWSKLAGGTDTWQALGGAMKHLGITFWPTFWGFLATMAETVGIALIMIGLALPLRRADDGGGRHSFVAPAQEPLRGSARGLPRMGTRHPLFLPDVHRAGKIQRGQELTRPPGAQDQPRPQSSMTSKWLKSLKSS
jgi:hypothetical protein